MTSKQHDVRAVRAFLLRIEGGNHPDPVGVLGEKALASLLRLVRGADRKVCADEVDGADKPKVEAARSRAGGGAYIPAGRTLYVPWWKSGLELSQPAEDRRI